MKISMSTSNIYTQKVVWYTHPLQNESKKKSNQCEIEIYEPEQYLKISGKKKFNWFERKEQFQAAHFTYDLLHCVFWLV